MSAAQRVFVGIDVACAKGKRLPLCVATMGARLEPLSVPPELAGDLPRGLGNGEVSVGSPFARAGEEVADALERACQRYDWRIAAIAIDAPAAPPRTGARDSEIALQQSGLSFFKTPDVAAWASIFRDCRRHLREEKALARLPHANKIWMLFGFELFKTLRARGISEVIEVYPHAIVRSLLPDCLHKSTLDGYRRQLEAVSAATKWTPDDLDQALRASVAGSRHDRLDAFMAAWVASLPQSGRRLLGRHDDPNDAIWLPAGAG